MLRHKKLIIIFGIILVAIVSLASFIRRQYCVPILMYHSVNPSASPENRLAVSVESFRRQMRFLKNNRYNVLPLEGIVDLIKSGKKIPPRTVAITLDDGYKDNYVYAFPILKEYNLPATMFIIVDEVGRKQEDRLSWDEIALMQASGIIAFGSHCLGPEPLVNIKSEGQVRREIFVSKKALEERLRRQVNMFSYPEGRFNDKIKNLVMEAGYKLAVATNPGKEFSNTDIYALKRLRIGPTSDSLFVFWVEASGYYNFMREHRHK